MVTPRDTQRSKIYRAEIYTAINCGFNDSTIPQLQWYVNKVCSSRWWKAKTKVTSFTVKISGISREFACSDAVTGSILRIDTDLFNTLGVLHLMSHAIDPGITSISHDTTFVKTYVSMVGRFMSEETLNELKSQLLAEKVKLSTWSPEAKAKAAERSYNKKISESVLKAQALIRRLENES